MNSTSFFIGTKENEPAEQYHAQREYISSSPLVEMAKSPLHFHEAWTSASESTETMDKGLFMHSLLLEQDIEKYAPRPIKDGRLVASNTKEYAAFLDKIPGKTPIHPDLYNEAMAILTAACANPTFIKMFGQSKKEVSFYGIDEPTALPIKARPDMLDEEMKFILDVKSTANMAMFEKQIFSLGYDVRLIHYIETIKSVTGDQIPEIYFFAIESSKPFDSKIFRLRPDAIVDATNRWRRWMNEISACAQDKKWPGYSDQIIEVSRPTYLENEQAVLFSEAAL